MSFEETKNALMSTGKIVFATGAAFMDEPFKTEAPTEPANESANQVTTTEPAIEVGGVCKNIESELCETKHQHPCVIRACRYLSEHLYYLYADTNWPMLTDLYSELRPWKYGVTPGLYTRMLYSVRLNEDERKNTEYYGCIIEKEHFVQVEDGFDNIFCLFTTGEEIQSIKETFEWYGFKLTGKEHNLLLCKYPNGVVTISMKERRPYDSGYYDNGHSRPYHYSFFKEIVLFNGRRHEGDEANTEGKWFYRWYIPSEFFKLAGRKNKAEDMKREWNINDVRAVSVEDEPGSIVKLHSVDSATKLKKEKFKVGGNTIIVHETINQYCPSAVILRNRTWVQVAFQCECGGLESTINIEPEVEMDVEPEIETEAESNGEIAIEVGSNLWYDVKEANRWFQDVWRFQNASVQKALTLRHFIDIARVCINKLINAYPPVGSVLVIKMRGGKVQHKTPQEAILILEEIAEKCEQKLKEEAAMRKEERKELEPVVEPEPVEEVEEEEDPSDTIKDGEVNVDFNTPVFDRISQANVWLELVQKNRNKSVRLEGAVSVLIDNARCAINELVEACPFVGAVLAFEKTPQEALLMLEEIEKERRQKVEATAMEKEEHKKSEPKEKVERAQLPEGEAKQISDFALWLVEERGKAESSARQYVSQAKSCVRKTGGFDWDAYIESLDKRGTICQAKTAKKEWDAFLFERSQKEQAC